MADWSVKYNSKYDRLINLSGIKQSVKEILQIADWSANSIFQKRQPHQIVLKSTKISSQQTGLSSQVPQNDSLINTC